MTQKLWSQTSPWIGYEKNQLAYFKPLASEVGTDNLNDNKVSEKRQIMAVYELRKLLLNS